MHMEKVEFEKYFISTEEFIETDKNPFIAGGLSLVLGTFGVHRFYLKRKTTGFMLLLSVITSFTFDIFFLYAFVFLLSWIEAIIYIIRGVEWLKKKYFGPTKNENSFLIKFTKFSQPQKNNKDQVTPKNSNGVEIIDVSDIKPNKINWGKEIMEGRDNRWIKRLEIPYERKVMSVRQVKAETTSFYNKLCNYIDVELKKKEISLHKEIRRIAKKPERYNNILYTIYCISEGHVTKEYSGSYAYYDPTISYRILESHLGREMRDNVFNKAQELQKNVSSPQIQTIKYFNLNEKGMPKKWWDTEGSMRESRKFNDEELSLLDMSPKRETVVWNLDNVSAEIINLYLLMWQAIIQTNGDSLNLHKDQNEVITSFNSFDSENITYIEISASLLKLAENTVRDVIPSLQLLNLEQDEKVLRENLSREKINHINTIITDYKANLDDKIMEKILDEMIDKDPTNWKLKAQSILIADDNARVNKLISYQKDRNLVKIAKNIIKNSKDEDLLLLALYSINKNEKLSPANNTLLNKIIYPGNIPLYETLIHDNRKISYGTLEELVKLKTPIRKTIDLNINKITESKEKLSETIDIITDYIDDFEVINPEEAKQKAEEKEENIGSKPKLNNSDFLKKLVEQGSIDIKDGQKIAMANGTLLNAFISEINLELYEYIQDQTIVIEEDAIKIDDFYIDTLKELITNEK